MAPHPSHRLSAWLVPEDPDRRCPPDAAATLQALIVAHRQPQASRWGHELLPGGWVVARLDLPATPQLYGNKQGGYRITCPACEDPLMRPAADALARWRAGQGRALRCPGCAADVDLAALTCRPPAAAGRFAVVLRDVEGLALTPAGTLALAPVLGGVFTVIGSRG